MLRKILRHKHWLGIGAAVPLGLIFVAAAVGKLGPQPNAAYMNIFSIPRSLLSPNFASYVDVWLPRIELALGLLIITGVAIRVTSLFSFILVIAFIFNNSWVISQGLGEKPCGCFGANSFLDSLTTEQALYIDLGMLALVSAIWLTCPAKFSTIRPWFLKARIDEAQDRTGSG